MSVHQNKGALVISLDFELHWGVRDKCSLEDAYIANLYGAREAIPHLLALFKRHDVAATWATVGFLFSRSRDEMLKYAPEASLRPRYRDSALSAYEEGVGMDEGADPLHFAPSLVALIKDCPRQELATHTYSHYYCLEVGQTAETFAADLRSAVSIAQDTADVRVRSIVFPRNQVNFEYLDVLKSHGIKSVRGNEQSWIYRQEAGAGPESLLKRAVRLVDSYLNLSGYNLSAWEDLSLDDSVVNVPSSRFLRPYSRKLRILELMKARRIKSAMIAAAKRGEIFHLWWHPHNFGANLKENIEFLDVILSCFSDCRKKYGMQSLTMGEVADRAPARGAARSSNLS